MGPAEPRKLRIPRATKPLRKGRRRRNPEGFVMEQQGPRSTKWYRLLPTYTADLVLELSEKASEDKKGWRMARSTAPDGSSAA